MRELGARHGIFKVTGTNLNLTFEFTITRTTQKLQGKTIMLK